MKPARPTLRGGVEGKPPPEVEVLTVHCTFAVSYVLVTTFGTFVPSEVSSKKSGYVFIGSLSSSCLRVVVAAVLLP